MEGMNYIIYSNEHGTVRVELIDGKAWYFAVDICKLLYGSSNHASYRMQKAAEEDKMLVKRLVRAGERNVYLINSQGFTALAKASECSVERTKELVDFLIAAREEAKKHQEMLSQEVKAGEKVEPEKIKESKLKQPVEEAEREETTVGRTQQVAKSNSFRVFGNREFGEIRIDVINGEPWFCLADVCRALELEQVSRVKARLNEDGVTTSKVIDSIGRKQDATFINEPNLYKAIFQSRKESAERFTDWVTSEVLPQIRKTGSYKQPEPQKPLTQLEMMRLQLGMIDSHEERIKTLEDTMTIDYGQQETLANTVSRTVITALGGKESNAYKEVARKVFAECNHDLKTYFNVNARNNVPRKRFDEAVEYAQHWKPCMNTQMMIRDCNAQMSF